MFPAGLSYFRLRVVLIVGIPCRRAGGDIFCCDLTEKFHALQVILEMKKIYTYLVYKSHNILLLSIKQ